MFVSRCAGHTLACFKSEGIPPEDFSNITVKIGTMTDLHSLRIFMAASPSHTSKSRKKLSISCSFLTVCVVLDWGRFDVSGETSHKLLSHDWRNFHCPRRSGNFE